MDYIEGLQSALHVLCRLKRQSFDKIQTEESLAQFMYSLDIQNEYPNKSLMKYLQHATLFCFGYKRFESFMITSLAPYPHNTDTALNRDRFVYAPSQWNMMLHCNIVLHWLGAFAKRSQIKLYQNSIQNSYNVLYCNTFITTAAIQSYSPNDDDSQGTNSIYHLMTLSLSFI